MIETLIKHGLWFAICAAVYFGYGCFTYSNTAKVHPWYFYIGLAIAFVGNLSWLMLAKRSSNPTEMLYIGVLWDIIILGSFLVAGLLFGAVHANWHTALGLALIVAGSVLLKL